MTQSALFYPLVLALATLASLGLTHQVRKWALAKQVLDIPNARSSHTLPTPRGGGLALVLVYCVVLLTFNPAGLIGYVLALSALLVGFVGFLDDVKNLSAKQRMGIHAIAGLLIALAVGGLPAINFGFGPVSFGLFGYVVAIVGVVWMTNLSNFMDGIDGLVASQVVLATTAAAGLLLITNMPTELVFASLLLAASTLGFLLLNWPPAKIFMGDVGSGTLGLIISGLMLWHTQVNAEWLFVWLILTGMLTVDASYTLLVRALRRQRLSEGHRSHAYQHLSQQLQSHKKVTLLEAGVLIVWLAPLASAVALGWLPGFWAMVVAYAPLIVACVWLKAGRD